MEILVKDLSLRFYGFNKPVQSDPLTDGHHRGERFDITLRNVLGARNEASDVQPQHQWQTDVD